MGKKSQSVINFEENVLQWLKEDGLTIEQAAKKVDISLSHAYKILDDVAKKAGLDKKSLLRRPHKKHAPFERIPNVPLKELDPETFNLHCDIAIEEVGKLVAEIREIIVDGKKILEEEK